MAKSQSTLPRIGLTPGKAVLIGALAIALGGVVYVQYGGSGEAPLTEAPRRRPSQRTATPTPAASPIVDDQEDSDSESALEAFDQSRWKSPELTAVVAHDPFALPAAFPQPVRAFLDGRSAEGGVDGSAALDASELADTVERLQQQLEELQQRGVHVIVRERDEYVAMIGDRMIHVGDEINGFTVTAIEPDGVRVERKGLE